MPKSTTTIMFTDIVGYSAMVSKNESRAMELLVNHDAIIEPILQTQKGKIIKKIGDAIFAEFPNANAGLDAAKEVQFELRQRNEVCNKSDQIQIRIGLHCGEVIRKDNDLFGNDVNLCARIESVAPYGGIAASSQILNSLENSENYYTTEMGYIKLKNIPQPQQLFKIYLDENDCESESEKQLQKYLADHGVQIVDIDNYQVDETFSVGILYISNLGTANDEAVSYNLTESLINDFGHFNRLRISGFNDVLQLKDSSEASDDLGRRLEVTNLLIGSLLKEENSLKLSFELLDLNTGKSLWMDSWSDQLTNSKKIRKKILESITAAFDLGIPEALLDQFSDELTQNSEALESYFNGKYKADILKSNQELEEARNLFQASIDIDNKFVEAYSELGLACQKLGYFDDAESNLLKGKSIAEGKGDDQGLASIFNCLGLVYSSWGKYEKSHEHLEQALKIQKGLNNKLKEAKFRSNFANVLNHLYKTQLALEQSKMAISIKEELEEFKSLGSSYGVMANTYFNMGDFTQCLLFAKKSLGSFRQNEMVNFEGRVLIIIAEALSRLGRYDEMAEYLEKAEAIFGEFNDAFLLGKVQSIKSQACFGTGEFDAAVEHLENSIDQFEMAEQRNFIIESMLLLIKIHLDQEDFKTTEKLLKKVENQLKKLKGGPPSYLTESMACLLMVIEDRSNVAAFDDLLVKMEKDEFDDPFAWWYLAQGFSKAGEYDKSKDCHSKAKKLLHDYAEDVSGKKDRHSFLNSNYFHKRIQEDISGSEAVEGVKEPESASEILPFCPSCGTKNDNAFAFCPSCGQNLKK